MVRGDDVGSLPGGGRVTTEGAFSSAVLLDVPPGLGLTPDLSSSRLLLRGARFAAVQNDGGAPLSAIKFSIYAELEG